MRIQHNIRSMNTNRQLKNTNLSKAKVMERLSSGYKINRASDDAAGLAISEKMRSQIRGLNQAARNVEDGISFVQVADGSLEEVQQMLHRMHELAVQSANGTNVEDDRGQIDSEVQQLKKEISDIFDNTEFNTKKIWKGEPYLVETIVGTTSVNGISILASSVTGNITDTNKEAIPASSVRVSATNSGLSFSWTGYNGKTYTTDTIPWEADPTGSHTYNIEQYMDKTKYPELAGINMQYGYSALSDAKVEDLIRALNGRTIYTNNYSYEESVVNSGKSNRILSVVPVINYTAELAADRTIATKDNGFIEGTKVGGTYANVSRGSNDSDPLVMTFDMRNIGEVKTSFSSATYSCTDTSLYSNPAAEGIWWRYYTSGGVQRQTMINRTINSGTGGLADLLYALDNGTDASFKTGSVPADGTVTLRFTLTATNPYTTKDGGTSQSVGSLSINIKINHDDTRATLEGILNSLTGIDINPSSSASTYRNYNSAIAKAGDIITHTYGYAYEYRGNLTVQAGANNGQILSLDYPVMSNEYLGIEQLAADSQQRAEEAITVSQEALQKVSKVRSVFGAFQNRLEHTLEYNKNASENLQNAESRLRDADYASDMVELSKNNILMEMGQQVLSMANSDPESVLNLLSL